MPLRKKIDFLIVLCLLLFFVASGTLTADLIRSRAATNFAPISIKDVTSVTKIIDELHRQKVEAELAGKDNLDGTIAWKTSRLMLGYAYAYEATGDTKYLDWFDTIAKDVLAQRDDAANRQAYDGINPVWSEDANFTNSWVVLKDVSGNDLIKLEAKDYNYNDKVMVAVYTKDGKQYMLIKTHPNRPTSAAPDNRGFTCYREITNPSTDPLRPAKNLVDLLNRIWPFTLQYGGKILGDEVVNPAYQGQTDDGLSWKIYGSPALWDLNDYMDPAKKVNWDANGDGVINDSDFTVQGRNINLPPPEGISTPDPNNPGSSIMENCFADTALATPGANSVDITTIDFYWFTPYVASEIVQNGIIDLAFSEYAKDVYKMNAPQQFKDNADNYVQKVKETISYFYSKDIWRTSGDQGWFIEGSAPLHKITANDVVANNRQAIYLANYVNLYEVTKDAQYKDWPAKFINFWKSKAGVKDEGYIWCYTNRWDSETIASNCQKEDISHGILDMDFFLRAFNSNIGVTQEDVNKFLVTANSIARTSDGGSSWYVDGTGDKHGWPIWLDLAQFDKNILVGEVSSLNNKIAGSNTGTESFGWDDIYWLGDTARWIKYYCDKGECQAEAATTTTAATSSETSSNLPQSGPALIVIASLAAITAGAALYFRRKMKTS